MNLSGRVSRKALNGPKSCKYRWFQSAIQTKPVLPGLSSCASICATTLAETASTLEAPRRANVPSSNWLSMRETVVSMRSAVSAAARSVASAVAFCAARSADVWLDDIVSKRAHRNCKDSTAPNETDGTIWVCITAVALFVAALSSFCFDRGQVPLLLSAPSSWGASTFLRGVAAPLPASDSSLASVVLGVGHVVRSALSTHALSVRSQFPVLWFSGVAACTSTAAKASRTRATRPSVSDLGSGGTSTSSATVALLSSAFTRSKAIHIASEVTFKAKVTLRQSQREIGGALMDSESETELPKVVESYFFLTTPGSA
mmetsp:Transcript_15919/g.43659  ORF Transcript_15919/g.43659 Transcript_15919/m.43659 type:complete len:316 (-) Transcript_15919:427-1374(-)